MSRNYNNGSRYMPQATRNALNAAANRGEISFQTAHDYAVSFGKFAEYAKDQFGVRYMEQLTPEHLIAYGSELADQVKDDDRSASSAQNLVSRVNATVRIASRGMVELKVSPVKDCGIPNRSFVRDTPTVEISLAHNAIDALREQALDRAAAVAELALHLGLRAKEASLLDARQALHQAQDQRIIEVIRGTKGGRLREVPINHATQVTALRNAAQIQGSNHNLLPQGQNWAEFKHGELRDGREMVKEISGGRGYHDLRASYAATRYQELTGHASPVNGGGASKTQDRDAREKIAKELGHNRIDVTANYLGGRR